MRWKTTKKQQTKITLLSAIPFVFAINAVLAKLIAEPLFDVWDALTVFILLILSFGCFFGNYAKKKWLLYPRQKE